MGIRWLINNRRGCLFDHLGTNIKACSSAFCYWHAKYESIYYELTQATKSHCQFINKWTCDCHKLTQSSAQSRHGTRPGGQSVIPEGDGYNTKLLSQARSIQFNLLRMSNQELLLLFFSECLCHSILNKDLHPFPRLFHTNILSY